MTQPDESTQPVRCLACDGVDDMECPWCDGTGMMGPRQQHRYEHFDMVKTSGTHELFRRSADELASKLTRLGTPPALQLAAEASEYARLFAEWRTQSPTVEERKRTIDELFLFQRRALDFLGDGS